MTTDTPGVDLDAIRRIETAATDGPWTLTDHPTDQTLHVTADTGDDDGPALIAVLPVHPDDEPDLVRADGEFIAKSRSLVPALLDIAEAACYVVGDRPCVEGECEHAYEVDENAPEDAPCPLVETRYATADDVIERDKLRAQVAFYEGPQKKPGRISLVPAEQRAPLYAAYKAAREWAEENGQSYTDDGIIQAAVKAYRAELIAQAKQVTVDRTTESSRVFSTPAEPADITAVRDRNGRRWVCPGQPGNNLWWLDKLGHGIGYEWHQILHALGPLTADDSGASR